MDENGCNYRPRGYVRSITIIVMGEDCSSRRQGVGLCPDTR
jgi:hypothetical protein